ncbi:hypothetical protein [Raoultibacter phocaeensis]|uniref:hypothetical protein n=1 Tax=Raoultibacter phocaeensis TaxID=2479841 RepID=UPI0011190D84|nr:hypothetical protein [Raoultibacter phocaeensis]
MKPRHRILRPVRTLLCLLLALSMVAVMTPIPGVGAVAAFADQEEGNTDLLSEESTYDVRGPAEWALDKVLDIAFELVMSAALEGLGQAADASGNEDLVEIVEFIDGVLGGSSSIEHECEKILKAVDDLSQQMADLEADIDAHFNALEQTITLNQIEDQRAQIVKMSDSVYAPALKAYNEYIQASKDYSDSIGTTNEANRKQTALTKERAMVAAFDKLDYQADLTTIETYGINMGNYTNHRYLYNLNKYADETLPFDHQRYALLTAGINDVAANLGIVAYVQRLEYDYWAAKAKAAPGDATLQQKALDLENALKTNLDRTIDDVNYLTSEYANKDNDPNWPRTDLLTLMRPYDFETVYSFDAQYSTNREFKYYQSSGNRVETRTWHYTTKAQKTQSNMKAYRICIDNQPYLVMSGENDLSYGAKHGDVIHGMRYWEKIPEGFGLLLAEYVGFPDQDFYNLLSTRDGVYEMPKDFTPLAPLVSSTPYRTYGGSLPRYLAHNGMSSLGSESYVIMNSYTEPLYTSGALNQNHYTKFNWYNTSIPASGDYGRAKVALTAEDSVGDARLLAVLTQKAGAHEAHPLYLQTEGSGLTITATDKDGNAIASGARVAAGSRVTITVSATEPSALDSLVLKNRGGEVLQTLASEGSASLIEGGTSNATFTFTMPYQPASLVGVPGKAQPNPLNFAEDADGAFLVSTLDDLVKVAAAYEQHPGMYENATFRLAADIVNLRTPFPAWTTPIGTEAHPFTGTFDGNGHSIGGFTMDMTKEPLANQKYGGIFGVIGETGIVRNVAVYGTEFSGDSANHAVGGLAGLNYGSITGCSTGSPQTGFRASAPTLTPEELRLMNSTATGFDAGGLVAVNRGHVLNCWSGADVTASANGGHAGGLIGYSHQGSSVWNSYAMGDVLGGGQVGGLIGPNYADVHNAYFCGASVTGAQAGSFIGANHHDVFASFVIEGAAAKPFGSGYKGDSPDSSLEVLSHAAMTSQTFADTLNTEVTGDMAWWAQSPDENNGFPYLVSDPMMKRTITDEATGVTLSGTMHVAARLAIEPLAENSASRKALVQHARDAGLLGTMAASYNALLPVLGKKSGQHAVDGTVTLRIPVAREHQGLAITVLQETRGAVETHDAVVREGFASIEIDTLSPFALVVTDDGSAASLAKVGDDSELPANLTALFALAALCVLGIVGGMLRKRRRSAPGAKR